MRFFGFCVYPEYTPNLIAGKIKSEQRKNGFAIHARKTVKL